MSICLYACVFAKICIRLEDLIQEFSGKIYVDPGKNFGYFEVKVGCTLKDMF